MLFLSPGIIFYGYVGTFLRIEKCLKKCAVAVIRVHKRALLLLAI
jgi:hypothetical protein